MATNAVQEALDMLKSEQATAQKEFDTAAAKLAQLNQAIAQLQNTVLVVDPENIPKLQDYAGLGILQAAEKFLTEIGSEGARTEEIAREVLARGVKTRSRRFVPTVYATLRNSKRFERHGERWRLKRQRGER